MRLGISLKLENPPPSDALPSGPPRYNRFDQSAPARPAEGLGTLSVQITSQLPQAATIHIEVVSTVRIANSDICGT